VGAAAARAKAPGGTTTPPDGGEATRSRSRAHHLPLIPHPAARTAARDGGGDGGTRTEGTPQRSGPDETTTGRRVWLPLPALGFRGWGDENRPDGNGGFDGGVTWRKGGKKRKPQNPHVELARPRSRALRPTTPYRPPWPWSTSAGGGVGWGGVGWGGLGAWPKREPLRRGRDNYAVWGWLPAGRLRCVPACSHAAAPPIDGMPACLPRPARPARLSMSTFAPRLSP
jgi:hypothetical protein